MLPAWDEAKCVVHIKCNVIGLNFLYKPYTKGNPFRVDSCCCFSVGCTHGYSRESPLGLVKLPASVIGTQAIFVS